MSARPAGQGTSSVHVRQHNQRLIMRRLRRAGEASRAELARAAALTGTAVGEIVKHLTEAGLVRVVRQHHAGMRGHPATMLALDPDGAYAIGVRLDRTRIETALADLGGTVLAHRCHDGALPAPERALALLRDDVDAFMRQVPAGRRNRIRGIGVARPYDLDRWLTDLDLPSGAFAPWAGSPGLGAALQSETGLPVLEENDGTAAAIAELFHGHGRGEDDFLYVFIGPALGGGLVLGGECVRGAAGNAADIGLIPTDPSALPSAPRGRGRDILLGRASLNALQRHLRWRGLDGLAPDAPEAAAAVAEWRADAVAALARPLLTARALLDVPRIVIDGDLAPPLLDALMAALDGAMADAAPEARTPPALLRGSFGAMAGALGAATLPLFWQFGTGAENFAEPREDTPRHGGSYALVA